MEKDNDLLQNILRNIVSEVLRECKHHRIVITEDFISEYIGLLELDPNRGLSTEILNNRVTIQRLVKYLVGKFENSKDPQLTTVRFQYEFKTRYTALEDAVQQFRKSMNSRLYPLLLDIIEQNPRNTSEDLYKKMSFYATLASGLGNPTHKLVFKEVIQVLKSVLTKEEIDIFPSLQNYIKQELVLCLVDIITGIRLYNRSCKKGGEGMEDLSSLMENGIRVVQAKFRTFIKTSLSRAKHMTLVVERYMVIRHHLDEIEVSIEFKSEEEKEHWERMRDLAILYRQMIKITRVLIEYVNKLDENRRKLNQLFLSTIRKLNGIIIPTLYQAITEVFPHFTDLARIWKEFQDDSIRLRETASIFHIYAKSIESIEFSCPWNRGQSLFEKWLEHHDDPHINTAINPNIKLHRDVHKFFRNELELNGYCCWVLTHTDGAVIPGVMELGILEYNNKFYAFTSKMAANCFIRNPDEYIMKSIEVVRKNIHLIKFLDMVDILKEYAHIKVLVKKQEKPTVLTSSVEVQTDTHFQDSEINYEYFWNIWDYKRAVIRGSNLTKVRTKATETDRTHQTESHLTQTYDPRKAGTQTMRDSYMNTIRPSNYFHGLRGKRKNYPFIMNLSEAQVFSQPKIRFNNKDSKN